MKRFFTACSVLFLGAALFAQSDLDDFTGDVYPAVSESEVSQSNVSEPDFSETTYSEIGAGYVKKAKVWPAAKRPQSATQEQINSSREKNLEKAGEEYEEETRDVFSYGMTDEICNLLDELTSAEDYRFKEEAYDLFQETKSPRVREKLLAYFAKLKDPCLENFAVEVLNDPYDERTATVNACFSYVSAVKSPDAIPAVVELLEKDDLGYFNAALECLGEIGGNEEAVYLISYLDDDTLNLAQRQTLMRVLGKLNAVETWEQLSEIAQDKNEDMYVRAYAAEAIGAMEVPESKDILIELYEADEPKVRESVIRGLSHYSDSAVQEVFRQALKDDNYRVRLEAINAVETQNITSASKDLIYHCKHKEENVVKEKCYKVLAKLNTSDGNEYLVGVIKDKKSGDGAKAKVAAALLENGSAGTQEIIELARETLKSDKQKSLRYALGKEFAKYGKPEFADICLEYIKSKDVATQGTGLDIYAKGRYSSAKQAVEDLAALAPDEDESDGKKKRASNVNAVKAKKILKGIGN